MTHPAGVNTRAHWVGPEVEGDLAITRAQTLFIASGSAEALAAISTVRHVFFTEDFHDWLWAETALPVLRARAALVTIARHPGAVDEFLAQAFAAEWRMVVRLSAPWVDRLRPQDAVSVGVMYRLVTFAVRDGYQTYPNEYLGDQ